jgi:heat shock protein HslJ
MALMLRITNGILRHMTTSLLKPSSVRPYLVHLRVMALVVTAGLLDACATPATLAAPTSLAGTHWELVAIQSMDDAQGTTRIAKPEMFTASFGADGRASFRLDCNRSTGSWKAAPASNVTSGSITFGPIATTRALCPPPHLDERIVRDLGYVHSYLLKEGKLYLSLMADGGIYEWRLMKP